MFAPIFFLLTKIFFHNLILILSTKNIVLVSVKYFADLIIRTKDFNVDAMTKEMFIEY